MSIALNILDKHSEIEEKLFPSSWPLLLRRMFVLTFPISVPIWGFAYVVVFLIFFFTAGAAIPFECAADLWKRNRDETKRVRNQQVEG